MQAFDILKKIYQRPARVLRNRIAGAKRACEAKRDTHMRSQITFSFDNGGESIQPWVKHHCSFTCRKNAYDGLDEFLVVTKETAQREEQATQEEIHRKLSQVAQLEST